MRARGSSSKAESRFGFDQHMVMIYVFLIVMSAIVGGVGGSGFDDDDESERARATTRDGSDASARRDAADCLVDDRGGRSCDWSVELDHCGAAGVADQQGDWRFAGAR